MTTVLDSWAVLRYLEDSSPAASDVAELLTAERPLISWINLGEVFYVIRRLHGEEQAAETVRDLRAVVDAALPDAARVLDAARIKADHPLAYADAFAAATALAARGELWTGDPELLVAGSPWRWRDLRTSPA
jgi:predicted nucleic acid-binding protein